MIKSFSTLIILLLLLTAAPLHADSQQTTNIEETVQLQSIDINRADIATLTQLKGIGEKRAQAIVTYREQFGDFRTIEDLMNVKGIGEQVVLKNKERIIF